jgi:hypothetical protein
MSILNKKQSYTFSKYFEMGIIPQDLAKEFGYNFQRQWLNLDQYQGELDQLENLKSKFTKVLPFFDLSNETSRREIFVSPIILDLVYYTNSQVKIEYKIKVTKHLQGYLDYLIENKNEILVIEAKKADLDYGMTQLIAELIALDQWENTGNQETLFGAVTTGNIWQFAVLNREEKQIQQDLKVYTVPEDLESLMRILVQALI